MASPNFDVTGGERVQDSTGAGSFLGDRLGKVPEIVLVFWIIKIAATTLGETGSDALSESIGDTDFAMSNGEDHKMFFGYAISSAIFLAFFIGTAAAQILARAFHPFLYWTVIIATALAGTAMADFATRSLGIGYEGGSLLLFALLLGVLGLWRFSLGSVSVDHISSPKVETFYWATILFSNTLGTALGDFLAHNEQLGFRGAALVFAGALAIVAAAYFYTSISRTVLFWMAFILTRPLGATVGDLLTKPREEGGFALDQVVSTSIIAIFIIACILLFPLRAGAHPGRREQNV